MKPKKSHKSPPVRASLLTEWVPFFLCFVPIGFDREASTLARAAKFALEQKDKTKLQGKLRPRTQPHPSEKPAQIALERKPGEI